MNRSQWPDCIVRAYNLPLNWPKLLQTISLRQWKQTCLLRTVLAGDSGERHIWEVSAELRTVMRCCWSVARWAEKQWQASLFLTLHFLQVSPHTANATCRLLRACVCLCLCVSMCVCMSVQGPGMQRWLNPRLSKKHARLPVPMTLNTHMAVLGKTNGRKMEYTSTAGTEKEEEGRHSTHWSSQPNYSSESWGKKIFIDFQPLFLTAVMYIWVLVCDTTYLPTISELL